MVSAYRRWPGAGGQLPGGGGRVMASRAPLVNHMAVAAMQMTTIAKMQPGRTYYTLAWALDKNDDGEYWLLGDYPAEFQPAGTLKMQIEKDPDGSYHVWVPKGERVPVSPWGPDKGDVPVSRVNGRKAPPPYIRGIKKAEMSQANGEMRNAQLTAKARGITGSPFLNDPPDVGVGDYGQYADASDYGYFRRLWIENHDWWALFNMTRVMEMG